jgi:hypothetical protein
MISIKCCSDWPDFWIEKYDSAALFIYKKRRFAALKWQSLLQH